MLESLRPGHPRLLFPEREWQRISALTTRDAETRREYERTVASAQKVLGEPPVERVLAGPRLLQQSRTALSRITLCAAVYRLGGDRRHAERALAEMRAAAAFKDWNPSHFLDVAEMTAALALGYDWLFDFLSPEDRRLIRQAIVEKGLQPGREAQKNGAWWATCNHNWNLVCHGGLTLGALAVGEDERELSGWIVRSAVQNVPRAMASYRPDGGWDEGPGYWGYATRYNVVMLAAMKSALGHDFGLQKTPGLSETGFFRMHTCGPTGKVFNYADCGANAGAAPQMYWLAQAFRQPLFSAHEQSLSGQGGDVLDLLWRAGRGAKTARLADAPLRAFFRRTEVACFRTAWDDPQAVFVGFKGGDNAANHSHLDLGTFVLDARGHRWCEDLGGDDYNLPGYFGKQRWDYYRLRTEGHNTLTINGRNQNRKARSAIVAHDFGRDRARAVADLTQAYGPEAVSVQRGVALLSHDVVLVQDEVELSAPGDIAWAIHTPAQVEVRGCTALLSRKQAQVTLRVLEPAGAALCVLPLPQQPERAKPLHTTKVGFTLPQARSARIVVAFFVDGQSGEGAPGLGVVALKDWGRARKGRR